MASRIKGRGASREDGPYSKDLLKLSKKELTKELTVLIDELRNFEQVRAREEKEVPGRRPQLSWGHYSKRTQWRCAAVESARAAGAAGGGGAGRLYARPNYGVVAAPSAPRHPCRRRTLSLSLSANSLFSLSRTTSPPTPPAISPAP